MSSRAEARGPRDDRILSSPDSAHRRRFHPLASCRVNQITGDAASVDDLTSSQLNAIMQLAAPAVSTQVMDYG